MRKLLLALVVGLVLNGCKSSSNDGPSAESLKELPGNKYAGGILYLNEPEFIKNLFPHNIIDAPSYRVATQVYEGLLKFGMDSLNLLPGLAESYTVNETGTIYVFKLRKNVKFHDNACFADGKGREFKASDVEYCFKQLCTPNANNQGFFVMQDIVKGANEFYAARKEGKADPSTISGIKVVDDYTIQIELVGPNSIFPYNLARPFTFIYPKEAWDKYGLDMRVNPVGTGPFTIARIEENLIIMLKRNPNYWGVDADGNKLPYLAEVHISNKREKKAEFLEFKDGKLDMIYRLPTDYMIEITEEANQKKGEYALASLSRTPEMAVHFLSFNLTEKRFQNLNLRKAISFAVDRSRILDAVLNGEGYAPGIYGVTPPDIFAAYDVKSIKMYSLNLDSARYYLRKAGFKDGKEIGPITMDLNSDGDRNINIGNEVKDQLKKNLNIDVNLNILTTAQLTENVTKGSASFFRLGWFADYPSPESFLVYFYGKNVPNTNEFASYPNLARYKNAKFDTLYEQALAARSKDEAYSLFLQAEKVAMADAPVIVLFYDEGYRLLHDRVKNFPNNAMQYRDLCQVYLVPIEKLSAPAEEKKK